MRVHHPGKVASYCPRCLSPAWGTDADGARVCQVATAVDPSRPPPRGACGASWVPSAAQIAAELRELPVSVSAPRRVVTTRISSEGREALAKLPTFEQPFPWLRRYVPRRKP